MKSEIITINSGGLFGLGVNSYLLKTDRGFILIDTGISPKRARLEESLPSAGCHSGNLDLIILTHGHGDHIGNCAYLQQKYHARVAMHRGDAELAAQDDPTTSAFTRFMSKWITWIVGIGVLEPFSTDLFLEDGQTLSTYGLDAQVLHLPGHSDGSIGILTAGGDLFCGDVFINVVKPARHSIVTNAAASTASIQRLENLDIKTVYPGHGKPFQLEKFLSLHSKKP